MTMRQRKPKKAANGKETAPDDDSNGKERSKPLGQGLQAAILKRRYFFMTGLALGVLIMLLFQSPQASEMSRLVRDNRFLQEYVKNLQVPQSLTSVREQISSIIPLPESELCPGLKLAEEGLRKKHPVVLVPGVVSTGLEVWKGDPCALRYFRQRIWGTMTMVQQFMLDTKCWLKHMLLDDQTGLDPPGVRVRAAQGFEAADYVIGGYWVWAKVIENLALVDYGPESMYMASYDWRLALNILEVRDRYFTKLKWQVEHLVEINKEKAVFVVHSMGTNVYHYFTQWVTVKHDKFWVDKHIIAMVNIAGPLLGLPKAVASMYSGETQEFRELGTLGLALQQYVNQTTRIRFFRNVGSVSCMLPRGGDLVWDADAHVYPGDRYYHRALNGTVVEDEVSEEAPKLQGEGNFSWMFVFRDFEKGTPTGKDNVSYMGVDQSMELLLQDAKEDARKHWIQDHYDTWYSHGIALTEKQMRERKSKPASWTNMLESPLPYAPKMHIYCIYGVNRAAERQYYYRENGANGGHMVNVSAAGTRVRGGIGYSDGDGSVPLLSLGTPCTYFWKKKLWNPSGVATHTRELLDEPEYFSDVGRAGPKSGDHVDIMGNHAMISDVIRIAAGHFDLPDRTHGNIEKITRRLEERLQI